MSKSPVARSAAAPTTDPLLRVEGLSKSFGGLRAVNDASFSVDAGSVTGLIGPNGAGKTTAFNLVSGTLRPDTGSVTFAGTRIDGLAPHKIHRRGVARTFQITKSIAGLSVLENVVAAASPRGLSPLVRPRVAAAERSRALDLLEFVGIAHLGGDDADNLSYGQRKLLELASALMSEPRLVLLDEPAGGVNPTLLNRIVERIRVMRDQGVTFLIVEHNMDMVMQLCDSVVVMAHGAVLEQASPDVVRDNPLVLDAYLGRV
jgi:neutral amino acid transport system ATP-binding protein